MNKSQLEDYLMIDKLSFCDCGDPSSVLSLIYHFINLSQQQRNEKAPAFHGKEWKEYCIRHMEDKLKLITEHAEAVVWLIYYFLDSKGIFEHGGNVSGGWLGNDEFFHLLKKWYEANDE